MSKVFKAIGTIAGVVATVGMIIPGPWTPIAAAVATVSGTLAQLTAKKPPARGSMTTVAIEANAPTPCLIGETYFGGVLRHDVGYGGKVGKVQNPYRGMVVVYSGCGPVESLVGMYADFISVPFSGSAATGYYAGFIYRDTQLGATPESAYLTPNWTPMTGWTTSHKLSGKAAILWNLKFDKDGKIFSSGVPQLGAVWQGVKAYDPTLDSTRAGGSGSHRIDDETTWEYSENPRDHALSYAYGRFYDGKKIFGIGLSEDAIDFEAFTAWGNVCDANGWKVGGVIFEPADRWENLKRIMAAGSAEPIFAGGVLSVKYDAPRVSLVSITPDDYADGAIRVQGMQTWRERINTIIPKYRSPTHKWEYVESDAISDSGYVTEDGEVKTDTYQVDLCQDKDQAAQLAAYRLVNGREIFPIEINLKPEFRFYRPGDMVTIEDPEIGLDGQDCVIVRRAVDPQTFAVSWTLMSETTAKHAFALGETGTAPPTPTLLDPEDRDDAAVNNGVPISYDQQLILSSQIANLGGANLIAAIDAGASASIIIEDHDRVYMDKTVAVTGATLTGLSFSTPYWIYYDDVDRAGGAVTFNVVSGGASGAANSSANPDRHYVGYVTTGASGGGTFFGDGGGVPLGWRGDNWNYV